MTTVGERGEVSDDEVSNPCLKYTRFLKKINSASILRRLFCFDDVDNLSLLYDISLVRK